MELSDRLSRILAEYSNTNLKPGFISQELNNSKSYINNIRNGTNKNPSDAFYDYFKIRCNINPTWLRTGKGDMYLEGGKQNNTKQAVLFSKILKLQPKHREAILLIVDSILASREDSV